MADATLTIQTQFQRSAPRQLPRSRNALVLVWSSDEPERVGELLLIEEESEDFKVYGRESLGALAGPERLRLARQRPGKLETLALSRSPRISRDQLQMRLLPGGKLEVDNVGRCPLLLNGKVTSRAFVSPGDVLELKEQQVFLCVERLSWMDALPDDLPVDSPVFGAADKHGLVGESPALWAVRRQVAFAADRAAHVLIHGQSGTGKELVARALHALSPRAKMPLIARNAATFPDTLIDAELFGNAKDYPNPGMAERAGLIGDADGSTLFLDEFGELPSEMQAHLLRVMDEGEYSRLGESRTRKARFRLVAATNRQLEALKHDVAARLKLRIPVPDLNERKEDIPLIARHLMRRIGTEDPQLASRYFEGGDLSREPRVTPALMTALLQHHYSNHVRELEGFLWQAMSEGAAAYLDVSPSMRFRQGPEDTADEGSEDAVDPSTVSAEAIREALERHNYVQARVWQELGLKNRFVLRRLMLKYGIDGEPSEPTG